MPDGSLNSTKVVETGQGKINFGNFTYHKAGIYEYTVKEINNHLEGYKYDKTVYNVVVKVDFDGRRLTRDVIYKVNNTALKGNVVYFTNEYKSDELTSTGGEIPSTGSSNLGIVLVAFLSGVITLTSLAFYKRD
jgi:pilin isopeptide linkage protein